MQHIKDPAVTPPHALVLFGLAEATLQPLGGRGMISGVQQRLRSAVEAAHESSPSTPGVMAEGQGGNGVTGAGSLIPNLPSELREKVNKLKVGEGSSSAIIHR
jgi:hypothetical protein